MTVMHMRPGERRFAMERADRWCAHIEPQCYLDYELVLDYDDPEHMWDRASKVIRPTDHPDSVGTWYAAIDRGWVKVLDEPAEYPDGRLVCPTCRTRSTMVVRSVTGPIDSDGRTEHLMESWYEECGHSFPWVL